MDNEMFGKFIKDLRKQNNMTQKQLGEKLHITDKAISKWERGLSFPDIAMLNSLAEVFKISISELINCKIGDKKEINIEQVIEDATNKLAIVKKRKINKIIRILSIILFVSFFILQLGYILILKKHDYEYAVNYIFYIVNEVLILSFLGIYFTLIKNKKNINIIVIIFAVILTITNIVFCINNEKDMKSIIKFSNSFSNELVLKYNKKTKEVKYYRAKFFIFARYKEKFANLAEENIKINWLTKDICSITYKDENNIIREFVATYGDRGNGISYNYVSNSLIGDWQVLSQYGSETKLIVDSKGITINKKDKTELFKFSSCKQFGTIALVLYKDDIPRYVIGLNEDCEIDEKTDIIKKGTILLSEISMNETITEVLNCIKYKNDDMSNYNISLSENDYKIKNGILYISYDGEKMIEVPGNFSNETTKNYNESNSQVLPEKTFFTYNENTKKYLVFSDDKGENWKTIEIGSSRDYIQNIHFINSNLGFMLVFEDVAMGQAFGTIKKTIDGGYSWQVISNGINETFSRGSNIRFLDENTGFLTIPNAGGEYQELYITKNGAQTFEKIILENNEIYDYYNLPTIENNVLTLKITQGSDGDYNGGDYKIYYSEDNGNVWKQR